jgi:hypothetical protein
MSMAEPVTSDVQRVEGNMANAFVGNKFLPSVRLATESQLRFSYEKRKGAHSGELG